MAHHHVHDHSNGDSSPKMALAVVVVFLFCVAEAAGGWFGHSLALLSDSGHNFADAAALGLSWYAIWISQKPANPAMTFGYHRVGILAALVNAVSLVLIAIGIFAEAISRMREPEASNGGLMIGLAAVAVVMNVVLGLQLHAGAKDNLNIRAAYVHMAGDAISALGVIIAGVLVLCTGWRIADPVVSVLIGVLILHSSWGILKESVIVLLEATPGEIDMDAVVAAIRTVPGVVDAHDLHVWTVGPGAIACSAHIIVAEQTIREGQQILEAVVHRLAHDFKINHTTVQVEVEGHGSNELYCSLLPSASHSHAH